MADGIGDVWRRALDANMSYYEAWGRAANDYVRKLGTALQGFSPQIRLPTIKLPTLAATPATVEEAPRPVVVLEALPGAMATGAVLVENHLAHPVSAPIQAHLESDIDIVLEPDHVDLAPGESVVVRVSATLPDVESTEIRGELRVPELVGTAVPLLIRSLGRAAEHPATGTG